MKTSLGFEESDRVLIINADDFGVTGGSNEAVLELLKKKAITSTSVMVPCPLAKVAIDQGLAGLIDFAGIHLALSSTDRQGYKPVYCQEKLRSLVNSSKEFYTDIAYIEFNASVEEVRLELQAQIEYVISKGIHPTHLDSHAGSVIGLHTGRDFLEVVFDLCQQYQLPFNLPRKILDQPFLTEEDKKRLARRIHTAEERGILLIDDMISLPYCFDMKISYDSAKHQLVKLLKSLKPGVTQLTVHPAIITEELIRLTPCYRERDIEYRLLTDVDIIMLLNKESIKLASWRDIRDIQRRNNR